MVMPSNGSTMGTVIRRAGDIRTPDRIVYGHDRIDAVGSFAADHYLTSALVVTDSTIRAAGALEPVTAALEAASVEIDWYDGVEPEPRLEMPTEAADRLRTGEHDLVIGCGGGSAMDTAKVAAVLAEHDVPIRNVLGMGNVPGRGRPIVLCPTTAGTGSEVTHIGVFADKDDDGVKRVVYDEALFADLAVLDPALTATLPPRVAGATGLDALTHAIEAYVSVRRTPYADVLAERAIELIGDNLRQAVHQGPQADDARLSMLFGSMLAGQAFVNAGLGAVHALTYPIGIEFGLGHGEANAMVLPHVMEFNRHAIPRRYARIADLLGGPSTGRIDDRAAMSVELVTELSVAVDIPPTIGDLGDIDEAMIDRFVDIAFEYSPHNIERNPRRMDRSDAANIFRRARAGIPTSDGTT